MQDQELIRAFGRVEAKLDQALERLDDHEKRVASLERAWQRVLGAAAVVSLVGSYLFNRLLGKG